MQHPELSRRNVDQLVPGLHIPFSTIPVFHRIKFVTQDPFSIDPADIVVDSVHCEPSRSGFLGRFDTAIINHHNGGRAGVKGMYVLYIACDSQFIVVIQDIVLDKFAVCSAFLPRH